MYRFELTYASITTVVTDPTGWDTLSINFERDALLNGFLFGFSPQGTSLGFIREGYQILKDAYDADGIGAEVLISIYMTADTPEVEIFTGRCNLSTLSFDLVQCIASVEVETYDVIGQIRSGLNTRLNLLATEGVGGTALLEVPVLQNVTVRSQDLLRVTRIGLTTITRTGVSIPPGAPYLDTLSTTIVFQDEVAYNLASPERGLGPPSAPGVIGNNINFPAAGTWLFEWSIQSFEVDTNVGLPAAFISVRYQNGSGFVIAQDSLGVTFNGVDKGIATVFSGSFNVSPTFLQNAQVYLQVANIALDPTNYTITGFQWQLSRRLVFGDTAAKALYILDCARAALNILSDGGVENGLIGLRSELMGNDVYCQFPPTPAYSAIGDAALLTLTDGLAIREFPITELNASLNDVLKTVVTLYAAGMGLTFDADVPTLRIEGLAFFYDRSQTLFILDVLSDETLTPELERIYTQVIQGFRRYDVETFSGFFDINNSQTWSAYTRAPENALDNTAPIIGSSYIIEFVRRQTVFTDGAISTTYDKDLFGLMVESDGGDYANPQTQRQDVLSFFGTPSTVGVRNADIHPTRALIRWLPFVNSELRNQSVEGVREYSRDSTADPIFTGLTEESPLLVYNTASLADGEKVFLPEVLTIKTPLDGCQLEAFKANPYAQVSVLLGGKYTYWFIQAVEFGLGDNTVNWTLLRSRTANTTEPPITLA